MEARENTRAKVLEKTLTNVRPESTRAAWAWRQRDKISSAWILALPSADTAFSNGLTSSLLRPRPAASACPRPPARVGLESPLRGR